MTHNTSSNYWISPTALRIDRNAMENPDRIQAYCTSGAHIVVYMDGVIGYDDGHNYRRWPLVAYPTSFTTTSRKYVYASIPKTLDTGNVATVVFPSEYIDVYGYALRDTDRKDEDGNVVQEEVLVGDENHWYIFLGGILSASVTTEGAIRMREWETDMEYGFLDSNLAYDAGPIETDWYKYDRSKAKTTFKVNLDLLHNDIQHYFDHFAIGNEKGHIPAFYDAEKKALCFDGDLYVTGGFSAYGYSKSTPQPVGAQYFSDLLDVKSAPAPSANQVWGWNGSAYAWLTVGGGGGGASSWSELSDRPTWLDDYIDRPYTRYGTWANDMITLYIGVNSYTLLTAGALNGYAKKTDLASYATQTWVEQKGYLTEHQSLEGYATQTWASGQFLGKNDKAKSAGSADKLATSCEIWGQTFNGTNGINGILNYVKDIMFNWQSETSRITTIHHDANALWVGMKADASASVVQPLILWDSPKENLYHAQIYDLNCFRNGNVEIGGRGQAYPDKFIVNGSSRFTGDMHVHGNLYAHNMFEAPFIELVSPNPFIDFHQGSGTSDYTARIIEWSGKPGILEFCSANEQSGTIKLGNACITYDDVNHALKVYGADGEQMHMYVTGGFSAYNALGSFKTLSDLNLTNSLTVGNEIKVGNYIKINKNYGIENNGITWDGTVITNSTPGAIYAESDFDIVGEVACSDLIASTLLLSGKGFGDNYCVTEISHSGTSIYISFRDGNRYKLTATKV